MSAQASRSKPRRESFSFLARKEPKNPSTQSTLPRHSLSSSFSPKSTARELPTHHQLNRQLSLPCAPPRRSSSLPQNQHNHNQPNSTSISTLANGLGLHFAGEERSTTSSRPSTSYQAASTSTRPAQLDEDAGGVVEWMDGLLEDLERVRLGVERRREEEGGTGRQDEDEREPTKESPSAHDAAQADLSTSSSLSSLIGLFPRPPSSSASTIRATSSDRLRVSISSGRDLPISEVDASKPPTPPPSPASSHPNDFIPADPNPPNPIITHFSQTPYLPNLTLGPPPLSQAPSSSSLSSSLLLPRTPSPIPCLALPPKRHTSLKHTSSWSFKTRKGAAERKRNELELAKEEEKSVEREEEGFVLVEEARRRGSLGDGVLGMGWMMEEKAKVFVIDEEGGEGRWVG